MRNISNKSVFLLFMLMCIITCQQEPDFHLDKVETNMEVIAAKQWYDANRPIEVQLRSSTNTESSFSVVVKPD